MEFESRYYLTKAVYSRTLADAVKVDPAPQCKHDYASGKPKWSTQGPPPVGNCDAHLGCSPLQLQLGKGLRQL